MPQTREDQLLAERSRTAKLIDELTGDFDSVVEAALEVALDDEHDPEGAGIAFERSKVDAVLTMYRQRLAALDQALARLRECDTEVLCEVCNEPISTERLEAQPAATRCVACASRRHRLVR